MAKNIDILLDANGEDKVENGDFAIGDGEGDDCQMILKLNTASLKSDPILAPNLQQLINSKTSPIQLVQKIKLNLNRDNKFPKKVTIDKGIINIGMK